MQSVLVVSANLFFRQSLARLLRSDKGLRVLGAAEFSSLIGEQVLRVNPEVVVLSPEWDDECFFAAHVIHEVAPQVKILLVGMKDDAEIFLRAVRAGAVGYLLKDASAKQIVAAARQLERNAIVCPPHLVWSLFRQLGSGASLDSLPSPIPPKLTPREQELSSLVAQGLANKEIAARLNLSVQTVKNHVHSILRKTQTKNRAMLSRPGEAWPSRTLSPEFEASVVSAPS